MKEIYKAARIMILILLIMSLTIFGGCKKPTKTEDVELSFDSSTAHFTSQKALLPVAGDYPAEGDVYEQKSVTLNANPSSRIRLVLKFDAGQAYVEGLKIAVNETVFDFENNLTLYDSENAVTTVSLEVVIFIARDASPDIGGKTVSFYFQMEAFEE